MLIYGWDMETWQKAFQWAEAFGFQPMEDYMDDPYKDYRTVRNMWFARGGPATGPRGFLV